MSEEYTEIVQQPTPQIPDGIEMVDTATIPKKKTRLGLVIALASVLLLIFLLLGTYAGLYMAALSRAQDNDFAGAQELLILPQVTDLHDAGLTTYVKGGLLLDSEDYVNAKATFTSLPGYENADQLALEADYRYAAQHADAASFKTAIEIYTALSEAGYKDSADKVQQTQFRRAEYLLHEQDNYSLAVSVFGELERAGYAGAADAKCEAIFLWGQAIAAEGRYVDAYSKLEPIRDHPGVEDALAELTDTIYQTAQDSYHNGDYTKARTYFARVPGYLDTSKYLTLITAHEPPPATSAEILVDDLVDILDFEDAAQLLLSRHAYAECFLKGTWKVPETSLKLEMDENGDVTLWYFATAISGQCYYYIEDGEYRVYKEDPDDYELQFIMKVLTEDTIELYVCPNEKTYTIVRQTD